jgi:hypothetical protein
LVLNSIKLHRTNVWDVNRVGQNHVSAKSAKDGQMQKVQKVERMDKVR